MCVHGPLFRALTKGHNRLLHWCNGARRRRSLAQPQQHALELPRLVPNCLLLGLVSLCASPPSARERHAAHARRQRAQQQQHGAHLLARDDRADVGPVELRGLEEREHLLRARARSVSAHAAAGEGPACGTCRKASLNTIICLAMHSSMDRRQRLA